MRIEKLPPYKSIRDLLIKDLQQDTCMLVWNDDSNFANYILDGVQKSEAYIVDKAGLNYMDDLICGMTTEDFHKSICNMKLPFDSVWIEATMNVEGSDFELGYGALIQSIDDGVSIYAVTLLPEKKPWRIVHSGVELFFHKNGNVDAIKTPIGNLYEAGRLAAGMDPDEDALDDFDNALRMGGMMAVMTAILDRPKGLNRSPVRALRKSEIKQYTRAGKIAPAYQVSIIRLSDGAVAEERMMKRPSHVTGTHRVAHWVRGHVFLARNGKLTWRRAHMRGEGEPQRRINRVTE